MSSRTETEAETRARWIQIYTKLDESSVLACMRVCSIHNSQVYRSTVDKLRLTTRHHQLSEHRPALLSLYFACTIGPVHDYFASLSILLLLSKRQLYSLDFDLSHGQYLELHFELFKILEPDKSARLETTRETS